jgi:cobalt-zinc-cadmium efflux system protein
LALLGDTGHVGIDFLGLSVAAIISLHVIKNKSEEKTIRNKGLAVQITLLCLIVGWLLVESWERFQAPIQVVPMPLMASATIGLALNALQLWILHPRFKNVTMKAARLHALQDLLGSVGVVASGIIIWVFGWIYADPVASFMIALWLTWQIYLLLTNKHTH